MVIFAGVLVATADAELRTLKWNFYFILFVLIGDGVNLTDLVTNILAGSAEEGGHAPVSLCSSWHRLVLLFWASTVALALLLFHHDILNLLIRFSVVY